MTKKEELKCFEAKKCSAQERKNCPAWQAKKNCWEVINKEPPVQCARKISDCVEQRCPYFMDHASEVTNAWLSYRKFSL